MKHYSFPEIRHISDVLPHIEGASEFIHAVKDGYQVINYAVSTPETFGDPDTLTGQIRRECRGLIFSEDGNIIARRFHKFFNVNEREETLFHNVDFALPHSVMVKLDGSMISPMLVRGAVRWATKMGITDTAMEAEEYVARNPYYVEFASILMEMGFTPIFEWVSPRNKIVIDYTEEALILTAIRGMKSGKYFTPNVDVMIPEAIPVCDIFSEKFSLGYMEGVRVRKDIEGVVVRFDSGHMVKVKADDYVLRHKSKDAITREKNVLQMIFNDQVDDVLPMLTAEDAGRLEAFREKVLGGVSVCVKFMDHMFNHFKEDYPTKRDFAIATAPNGAGPAALHGYMRAIMFALYDGKNTEEVMLDMIRKNLGSTQKIESVRELWYGFRWKETDLEA